MKAMKKTGAKQPGRRYGPPPKVVDRPAYQPEPKLVADLILVYRRRRFALTDRQCRRVAKALHRRDKRALMKEASSS